MNNLELIRFADDVELARAAAGQWTSQLESLANASRPYCVALSGGRIARRFFEAVVVQAGTRRLPLNSIEFFWGDERHVPPDHPESNYRMAYEALLSKVPVPAENVFRVPAEIPDANQAAADYEQTLRKFFQLSPGAFPRFDLILLGMGPDGHTASLFPGTSALQEKSRLVVANWVEKFKAYRITFTLPVLNNAAVVTFLVGGADKAETVREVLEGTQPAELLPSKLIHPTNGRLMWMLDQAAAVALSKP